MKSQVLDLYLILSPVWAAIRLCRHKLLPGGSHLGWHYLPGAGTWGRALSSARLSLPPHTSCLSWGKTHLSSH